MKNVLTTVEHCVKAWCNCKPFRTDRLVLNNIYTPTEHWFLEH